MSRQQPSIVDDIELREADTRYDDDRHTRRDPSPISDVADDDLDSSSRLVLSQRSTDSDK